MKHIEWTRELSLSSRQENEKEYWVRRTENDSERFPMDVYLGKKTDLLKLKSDIVNDLKSKQKYYKESRTKIYEKQNTESVNNCPICNEDASNSTPKVIIYDAEYIQCNSCTHVYVANRPTKTAIEGFYLNDVTYAATYTNKTAAESRLNAIAVPWLKWTMETYKKHHGHYPKSVLDVGSGAGHFVEACRRAGLKADGIELSDSSRKFSQEIWGIDLDGRDFMEAYSDYKGYDVVTFWGLLEHTPNPSSILQTAYKIIESSEGGMVISKVPRWESLSAAIQRLKSDTIIRHLDPMGHIMCFTDQSAAEIYYQNQIKPVSAWYYGMDVYEMLMQISTSIDQFDPLTKTGHLQVELQQFVDEMRFADGLTLAGVPMR